MAIKATFPLVAMSAFVGGMVGLAGRELGKWRCGVDDVWERGGAPKQHFRKPNAQVTF